MWLSPFSGIKMELNYVKAAISKTIASFLGFALLINNKRWR